MAVGVSILCTQNRGDADRAATLGKTQATLHRLIQTYTDLYVVGACFASNAETGYEAGSC